MKMTEREIFLRASYQNIKEAFLRMDGEERQDVYALSFWFYNEDDDARYPKVNVSFNTTTHFKEQVGYASSEAEAKWNYAYWLQDELLEIGGSEDELLRNWFVSSPYYFSDEEEAEAVNDDLLFEQLLVKSQDLEILFIEGIKELVISLHNDGIIKASFGRKLPVIVHELEYYDKPISWTKEVNESYLIEEFVAVYTNGEL